MPPRIFIIATGSDVRTVREIAKRQFVQDGLQIVELSRLGEQAKKSDERQEVAIGECDAVFQLIGCTFGPKPAQFDLKQRRRSYGEIEHEIAQRQGKPIFTVVCADHYFFDHHEPDAASLQKFHHERRERILKSDVPHQVVKHRRELLMRIAEFIEAVKLGQFGPGWQTDAVDSSGGGGGWTWSATPGAELEIEAVESESGFSFVREFEPSLTVAHPVTPISFALYGPDVLAAGGESEIDLWLFAEEQRSFMENNAVNRDTCTVSDRDPDAVITFDLRLTIPSLQIHDETASVNWAGVPTRATWIMCILGLGDSGGHRGFIEIRALGARVATLYFQLLIGAAGQGSTGQSESRSELRTEIDRPRTAFVCYASDERAYLDAVLLPLAPLWPEVELFVDVDALREQDDWWEQCQERIPNSDLFLLLWSSVADQSELVQRELALALEGRGRPEIVPFPIENAELAPPPTTLPAEQFEAAFKLVVASQDWPAMETEGQAPVE
jgi:hypothetical protein